MIHQQDSYAPRSRRRTGRRKAQNLGPGPHSKNIPCTYNVYQGLFPWG
jgi:hypothetical protein